MLALNVQDNKHFAHHFKRRSLCSLQQYADRDALEARCYCPPVWSAVLELAGLPVFSRTSHYPASIGRPWSNLSAVGCGRGVDGRYVGFTLMWERSICGFRAGEAWGAQRAGFVRWTKAAITSKIKHAIKLKTSPARLAQLLQPV